MSDCVYVAWTKAARANGVRPYEGARHLFDTALTVFGEPGGLWAGAAPLVVAVLCRMHGLRMSVRCHPWFDAAYYRAAAVNRWHRWAVAAWRSREFSREVKTVVDDSIWRDRGCIQFWLAGHHAYYAREPRRGQIVTMQIRVMGSDGGGAE